MKSIFVFCFGFLLASNCWGVTRTLTFYSLSGHSNDRIKMHIEFEGSRFSEHNHVNFEYCPTAENCYPIADGRSMSMQDLGIRLDQVRPSLAQRAKKMALAAGVAGPTNAALYELMFFAGSSLGLVDVTPAYHVVAACIGVASGGFAALMANNAIENNVLYCQHAMWDAFKDSAKRGSGGRYDISAVDLRTLASTLEQAMTL